MRKIHYTKRNDDLENQPYFSLMDNCTAGYPDAFLEVLYWFVIPCDELMTATYVCQVENKISFKPLFWSINALNKTCDQEWFLMEGTQKCYTILTTNKRISFLDAQHQCKSKNSSILEIIPDHSSSYLSVVDKNNIVENTKRAYFLKTNQNLHYDDNNIIEFILGKLLHKDKPINQLANKLALGLVQEPANTMLLMDIKVFAFIGSYCGIIEYNYIFNFLFHFLLTKHIKAWGAKYRSCSKLIDIDAMICEKASEFYISHHCANHSFECGDRTCILIFYRCDYNNDCFDGSDEDNCIFSSNSIFSNDTIWLPCQLNQNCSVYYSLTRLPLHCVCDGIFSTSTFADEKLRCQNVVVMDIVLSHSLSDIWNIPYKNFLNGSYSLFDLFFNGLVNFGKDMYSSAKYVPNTFIKPIYKRSKVLCSHSESGVYINQRCTASKHTRVCDHGFTKKICQGMLCPGMFKCKDYYCIHMSAVCDGQLDCLYGDDEKFCNSLICPGFLKCRGEMRCVGVEEMRDGTIDCRYSCFVIPVQIIASVEGI